MVNQTTSFWLIGWVVEFGLVTKPSKWSALLKLMACGFVYEWRIKLSSWNWVYPLVSQEKVGCRSPIEAIGEIRRLKDNWRGWSSVCVACLFLAVRCSTLNMRIMVKVYATTVSISSCLLYNKFVIKVDIACHARKGIQVDI